MTLDRTIESLEKRAETANNRAKELSEFNKGRLLDFCDRYIQAENDCIRVASECKELAEWLKQLKEIKRILDAPSYEENGVTYSYCYDSDTKLKHIREVVK